MPSTLPPLSERQQDTSRQDAPKHIPVLLSEMRACLQADKPGIYLDGTFGAGGYTRAILAAHPQNRVLALDRDPQAIRDGWSLVEAYGGRLTLAQSAFSDMANCAADLGFTQFDGIVLDIGVSSMQLDKPERGFSFRTDGPLDMRMEQNGESAADLVNTLEESALADVLYYYGEERLSRRIARAIVHDRKQTPFTTTRALADMIGRVAPGKPNDIHPATRSFQALRIAVNDELGELVRAMFAAETLLAAGGRLVVVTFHSLEDRIVKQFFAARTGRGGGSRYAPVAAAPQATFTLPGKFPLSAQEQERADNPRARSAKLRAGIRTATPAGAPDPTLFSLAELPETYTGSRRKLQPRFKRKGDA